MASWHSGPLHVSYEVVAELSFPLCFSVVGLNFDYAVVNFMKQTSYLFYNASLYLSSAVQKQYKDKYGQREVCSVSNTCQGRKCTS
ncbi:Cystinosin-like protein [Spatholobus suberectus]|nr:Cystinosin-like protein [Spatholobus suberectus]